MTERSLVWKYLQIIARVGTTLLFDLKTYGRENVPQTGGVLLVAMIGTIVLTLRHRRDAKRQNVARQVGRRRQDAVEVVRVETGKGIT